MNEMNSPQLHLPLVQPAQAQKHVTVNEALLRLDALLPGVVQSRQSAQPPQGAAEGQAWIIPTDAQSDWAGRGGQIAMALGGGWAFAHAAEGQSVHVLDEGRDVRFLNGQWAATSGAASGITASNGATLALGRAEGRMTLGTGAAQASTVTIPAGVMVIGAVARVIDPIGGTAQTWKLGTEGAADRFGSGLGKGAGAWARGMLSQPMTYWQAAPLILTGQGGTLEGGSVDLAVFWLELGLPSG